MKQLMPRILLSIMVVLFAASPSMAQFGGRANEVVLYFFSSKGKADFQIVPAGSANTATGFQILDPLAQPVEEFGPDFPGESRRLLHKEDSDNFMMIVQREWIESPHQQFMGAAKVLIASGMLRLLPPGKDPIDAPAGFFATFPQSVDFGPDIPVFQELAFLWTPSPLFPIIQRATDGFVSPINPPGLTGEDYVVQLGKFLALTPWVLLQDTYPGAGWPEGIDAKLVDQDASLGTTARVVRLRPGKTTPAFRLNANTHVAVLSGSVQIAPVNGTAVTMKPFQYAFLPNNFAITLSNPVPYTGPTGIVAAGAQTK